MITLSKVSKKIGTRTLFEDVCVTFNPRRRYGLTGPNGAGKSTLLKILLGGEPSTSGSVKLPKKTGFLHQNIEEFRDFKLLDVVVMGNRTLWKAMSERDELYEQKMTDAIGMRLGDLEEIIAEEDGYSADSNAALLLSGIGIPLEMHEKQMFELPTDLQFRVLLCQALFGNPEALLLDEPTNHLDLESIGWLETFLLDYVGTLVVISHDRHFLNAITTDIADIDYETIIIYPGNYDDMLVTKTAVREKAEKENRSKEKRILQLRTVVAKFGAGTRASQMRSKVREIDRLKPAELKKSNIERPYVRFPSPETPSGQTVLRAKKIGKAYDTHQIIQNFSIEIERFEKIAVIGSNGMGKTTLLKMLAKKMLSDSGNIEWGHQVNMGYFPQDHSDLIEKSETISVFDWIKRALPEIYDQEIRSVLGKLLFSGDDAFKQVCRLSGGESARLILSTLMLGRHNTLVLDEPNNHLDLESVSALGHGLKEFRGTVILATHNRDLINQVATKTISLEKGGIVFFDGNLEEYLQGRE